MSSAQRLVTSGQLHPAGMVTRCGSLVALGGPVICGLNKRPYFARREAMISHIRKLVQYWEEQWVAKAGTHRTHALRPYTYRPRKTAAEIEAHRLHRALCGNLQTGLAPASGAQLTAKGGATGSNFGADFFPIIGDGRLPQRPYTGTRRHAPPAAQANVARAPANATVCDTHSQPACITCRRLRKTAQECCSLGHHEAGHVPRRLQLQLCEAHRLPPCPICARTQRGVRHCCARGHHKVCTPVQPSRKRCTSQQPKRPYKRPRVGPSQTRQASLRSPHQPPTPPAPKRRRPKTPSPPSPPTPVPQGLAETPDTEAICRQLFLGAHGRASSEVT